MNINQKKKKGNKLLVWNTSKFQIVIYYVTFPESLDPIVAYYLYKLPYFTWHLISKTPFLKMTLPPRGSVTQTETDRKHSADLGLDKLVYLISVQVLCKNLKIVNNFASLQLFEHRKEVIDIVLWTLVWNLCVSVLHVTVVFLDEQWLRGKYQEKGWSYQKGKGPAPFTLLSCKSSNSAPSCALLYLPLR